MNGFDYSKLTYLIIMGIIVVALLYFAISDIIKLGKLKNGKVCAGRISAKRLELDEGKFYYVTYEFKDDVGKIHTKEIQVRRPVYEYVHEDQAVNVAYLPENPEHSYFSDDEFKQSYYKSAFTLLFFAFILSCVGYFYIHECIILNKC